MRGVDGESAGTVLSWVDDTNRYRFDQACRVKAIELASRLGLASLPDCRLSINFLPNAVYRPETCFRATMEAAEEFDFPHSRIMFEVTEGEQVTSGATSSPSSMNTGARASSRPSTTLVRAMRG